MNLTKYKCVIIKMTVLLLLIFVALILLTEPQKRTTHDFSKENIVSDMQMAKGPGSIEEAESFKEYVTTVLLLLVIFSQCTGQKVYLAKSNFLENPKIVQILRFIQQIDGKKEQISYCA